MTKKRLERYFGIVHYLIIEGTILILAVIGAYKLIVGQWSWIGRVRRCMSCRRKRFGWGIDELNLFPMLYSQHKKKQMHFCILLSLRTFSQCCGTTNWSDHPQKFLTHFIVLLLIVLIVGPVAYPFYFFFCYSRYWGCPILLRRARRWFLRSE